jgi:hypothetical protein
MTVPINTRLPNRFVSDDASPLTRPVRALEANARLHLLAHGLARIACPLGHGAKRAPLGGDRLSYALHPQLTDFPWVAGSVADCSTSSAARLRSARHNASRVSA